MIVEKLKETHRGTILKFFEHNDNPTTSSTSTIYVSKLFGALNTSHELLYPNGADDCTTSVTTGSTGTELSYYDLTFYRAWYDIGSTSGGRAILYWEGDGASTPDSPIISFAWSGDYNVEGNWIAIKNPLEGKAGVKGNLKLKTFNVSTFTVIVEVVKDNLYYNSGEIENPNVFNYGKFGVTP